MADEKIIPLFPLELVLLPDMPLPLHIFEDRYKLMIGECLEGRAAFGIVYSDGRNVERVGCSAAILHVLNRYEDGRLDILAAGRERFHILDTLDRKPYLEARVEFFKDEEEAVDDGLIDLGRGAIRELEKLASLTGRSFDGAELSRLALESLSFVVVSADGIPLEERQRYLEMTGTRRRLEAGTVSLRTLTSKLYVKSQLKKFFGSRDTGPEVTPL